jgi:hypothetical protein
MKNIIIKIFDNVKYWQDKKMLLKAINSDYYKSKEVLIELLGITPGLLPKEYEPKRDMWNHMINDKFMGDDILEQIDKNVLNDIDFAKRTIYKYNRSYVYLTKSLKKIENIALMSAEYENERFGIPILRYMPEEFQKNNKIAIVATKNNIENLQYATNLKANKYFLEEIMQVSNNEQKSKILSYIDEFLLQDKKFVSRLGCFDNLCENFHGDIEYLVEAVKYDISILQKTDIFDVSVIQSAFDSNEYYANKDLVLVEIFNYIERFNIDYEDLCEIEDKTLLLRLMWELGQSMSSEFLYYS